MNPERITALVVSTTPLIAVVASVVIALITRPQQTDKSETAPTLGMTVDTSNDLVSELRDRMRNAEAREHRAWDERDAYRSALDAANTDLAAAGYPPRVPRWQDESTLYPQSRPKE